MGQILVTVGKDYFVVIQTFGHHFVGAEAVEEACFSAVSHFTNRRESILNLFTCLHVDLGRFTREQSSNQDSSWLKKSAKKSVDHQTPEEK